MKVLRIKFDGTEFNGFEEVFLPETEIRALKASPKFPPELKVGYVFAPKLPSEMLIFNTKVNKFFLVKIGHYANSASLGNVVKQAIAFAMNQ